MRDVSERVVVITGASRGLGAGMAGTMAAAGARLGLCARSTPEPAGATALCRAVDVTDAAAVERFGDAVAAELGPIDLWINNAGVLEPVRPVRDCEPDEIRRHLEVNLLGVVHGSRVFVRHRRAVGPGGVLVNLSSGAAQRAYAGWGAYCAGKAAVERFSEVLALEERDAGTRVHAVQPGVVDTGMQTTIRAKSADEFPSVEKFQGLKQDELFNSPAYVAERILELAFDPARRDDDVVLRLPNEWET